MHPRLGRHLGAVHVSGHGQPFRHDLLHGLVQMAVFLGKHRRLGEHRVGHALVVFPGVGQPPLAEKRGVHLFPNAVAVGQHAVHVENQHLFILILRFL